MKHLITITIVSFIFISPNVEQTQQIENKVKIYQKNFFLKNRTISKVNIIELPKGSVSYKIVNKNHRKYDFYINSNYFTIENDPVGEVKINGKTIKKRNKNGGFFTSNGDKPSFYFNDRPNNVLYSSQTHTPIIEEGTPNYKIFNQKWAKYKLPRLLIGEKRNGDIVVVHTIENSRCSVYDFYLISKILGLKNSLMFDGGASIEVGLSYKDINYKYQIVSDLQRKIGKVPTPSVFIVGTFN
jgi:hypothetical protein